MTGNTDNGLTLVVCERGDAVAWAYFPLICRRVSRFVQEYDSDADIFQLTDAMAREFVSATPAIIAIGLLNPKAELVGHLLVQLEDWYGSRYATIVQLEVDHESALTPEVIGPAYDWIKGWAQKSGVKRLQCMARNDAVARLFRQRYGFEKRRTLMTVELADAGENVVAFPQGAAQTGKTEA